MRSANTREEVKSQEASVQKMACFHQQVLKDAEARPLLATQERSHYRTVVEQSKKTLPNTFTVDGQLEVPPSVHVCHLQRRI